MLLDKVHWRDSVEVPAQRIQKVKFAAFDCFKARVSATWAQLAVLSTALQETSIQAIPNERVSLTELLDHRDVVVDFVKFRRQKKACDWYVVERMILENTADKFTIRALLVWLGGGHIIADEQVAIHVLNGEVQSQRWLV